MKVENFFCIVCGTQIFNKKCHTQKTCSLKCSKINCKAKKDDYYNKHRQEFLDRETFKRRNDLQFQEYKKKYYLKNKKKKRKYYLEQVKRLIKTNPEYRFRRKVRAIHSYYKQKIMHSKCDICGSKNNLQMHHIEYVDNLDFSKIQTLCRGCHRKVHWIV